MSAQLKLTAKGQITLKKEFLQHLGAEIGSFLAVEKLADGALKISVQKIEKNTSFAEFAGLFDNPTGKNFSIEELNEAISDAYAEVGIQGVFMK